MNTKLLETFTSRGRHPSFPDGMLAYGAVALSHVAAAHPSYGIHNIGADDVRETRQSYNSGGAR